MAIGLESGRSDVDRPFRTVRKERTKEIVYTSETRSKIQKRETGLDERDEGIREKKRPKRRRIRKVADCWIGRLLQGCQVMTEPQDKRDQKQKEGQIT